MIKHYCDVCGAEVDRNYVSKRLVRAKGKVTVEVLVAINGAWNHGDICLACLMDAMNAGTAAPKQEPIFVAPRVGH